jgi:hypothetical protein
MFVFAIETCGKTVAFTGAKDRIMLDKVLKGWPLRDDIFFKRDKNGALWDGVSPFTARLASASEELEYNIATNEYRNTQGFEIGDDESILIFNLINMKGENVLMIPPVYVVFPAHRAA